MLPLPLLPSHPSSPLPTGKESSFTLILVVLRTRSGHGSVRGTCLYLQSTATLVLPSSHPPTPTPSTGLSNPAWASFELPASSTRVWYSPTNGVVAEKIRYDSWECSDLTGVSRTQFTHVEVYSNGTTKTDTKCAMYQIVDSVTMNSVYHACDDKPSAEGAQWEYTNVRAPNATVVEGSTTPVCVGSSDVKLDTSGGAAPSGPLPGKETTISNIGPVPTTTTLPEANAASEDNLPGFSGSGEGHFVLRNGVYFATELSPGASPADIFAVHIAPTSAQMFIQRTENNTFATGLQFNYDIGWEPVGAPTNFVFRGTLEVGYIDTAWNNTAWLGAESACVLNDLSDPYLQRVADCSDPDFAEEFAAPRLYFLPPNGELEDQVETTFATALDMDGTKQVPPLTNVSTTANFYMTAPNLQGWITYDLDVEMAGSAGGYTMSHIHCGNSTSNGEVCVVLVPTAKHWPTPIVTEGGLPELTPPVNVTCGFAGAFSADQFVGPLAGTTMVDFVKMVRENSENFYVNVHSAEYPAGAVRAQLQANSDRPGPGPVDSALSVGAWGLVVAAAAGLAALLV